MSEIQVNTINEYTGASGVTIDGLLIKDGAIPSISGGKVLQVVSVSGTSAVTVNTTTYTSLVSLDITPSATTSTILLFATGDGNPASSGDWNYVRFLRDSTEIGNLVILTGIGSSGNNAWALHTLDSPSSTSEITYSIRAKIGQGSMTYGEIGGIQTPTITALEIGV